jgi:alkanesulfonate monooxygenase SsuD/methylene tetrahydromethanopterin reductase-like flavin-dependent oxidoreductase (luciferase family)
VNADDLTPTDIHPWVAAAFDRPPGPHDRDGAADPQSARGSRIRFGISIFPQTPDWRAFIRLVQWMEAHGIDSYWSYDHPRANADCWTALTAFALSTERIWLGTMVDCIFYRPPYLLARMAADVDRISGGRLLLGLGIGDQPDEFAALGLDYPPVPVRQKGMEETIRILRGLWSGEPFDFAGEVFRARGDGSFLPPVQRPRIPILLGGGGEKVTLRQVARFADASNMGAHDTIGHAFTDADVARKFGALRDYCDEIGRPFASILRSQFTMPLILAETRPALDRKMAAMPQDTLAWCGPALFAGTPEEAVAFYRGLAGKGFQYFVANILGGDDETVELLAEAVQPAFALD